MSMKLSIGLARKVGQPNYGSIGASCSVELEVELAGSPPEGDPAEFRRRVRAAYAACDRAVREELARQQADYMEPAPGGPEREDREPAHFRSPATAAQVRALTKLAERRGYDLDAITVAQFGVNGPENLSIGEASRLIDELQQAPADATA